MSWCAHRFYRQLPNGNDRGIWRRLCTMAILAVALRIRLCCSLQGCSNASTRSGSCFVDKRLRDTHNHANKRSFVESRLSQFHATVACRLNRFLFDPSEVDNEVSTAVPTVTLPKQDYRTIHAAKILGVQTGDKVRAGLVGSHEPKGSKGMLTDEAVVEWMSEADDNKPLKNEDPPGSLRFRLEALQLPPDEQREMCVSLILALPRPLQLGRLLPMISQLGVDHLVLTSARKVQRDYFGSHLLRQPAELRERLIEGLCQAGDVRLPKVHIFRNLRSYLDNELDDMFPVSMYARVVAHPRRLGDGPDAHRMSNVEFPSESSPARVVVAVGPEGGWSEPNELQHFHRHGFQQVTLGTRVLRSDVAVVSLLSLAHEACEAG